MKYHKLAPAMAAIRFRGLISRAYIPGALTYMSTDPRNGWRGYDPYRRDEEYNPFN
jgi:hypothetical protein